MTDHGGPWRLKDLTSEAARARLRERPTLIVPVGGTAAHSTHLPLGTDSIIVERLADDVSTARGLVTAPVLEYGVHPGQRARDGGVALRRKTLHRVMNELIDSWEAGAGITRFVILTALADDSHLEALSTVRTEHAELCTLDVMGYQQPSLAEEEDPVARAGELVTSLLLHVAPHLVVGEPEAVVPSASSDAFARGARRATAGQARDVYQGTLERILRLVDAAHKEVG
jgi:creatinine amidohydrolase